MVLQGHASSVAQSLDSTKKQDPTSRNTPLQKVEWRFPSLVWLECYALGISVTEDSALGLPSSPGLAMAQMCWTIVEVSLCVQRLTKLKGFIKWAGRNGQPVSNSYLFFNTLLLIASKLHLNLPANNQWHLFYIWFQRYEAIECEDLNLHFENGQILLSNKWDLLKSKQSLLCSQLQG